MVRLTPLARWLLAIAVLALAVAAMWHLGLKKWLGDDAGSVAAPGVTAAQSLAEPLGTAGNPLKVSIVSFHGYAPGLLANGKSLKTTSIRSTPNPG